MEVFVRVIVRVGEKEADLVGVHDFEGVSVGEAERVRLGVALVVLDGVREGLLVAVGVVVCAAQLPAWLALAIAEPRIGPGVPFVLRYHSTLMLWA